MVLPQGLSFRTTKSCTGTSLRLQTLQTGVSGFHQGSHPNRQSHGPHLYQGDMYGVYGRLGGLEKTNGQVPESMVGCLPT